MRGGLVALARRNHTAKANPPPLDFDDKDNKGKSSDTVDETRSKDASSKAEAELAAEKKAAKREEWMMFVGAWGIFTILFVAILGYAVYKLSRMYYVYRRDIWGFKTKGFKEYLFYNFEVWFERTDTANAIIILTISGFTLFMGAVVYGACTGTNLFLALWRVFAWLVAPDAGTAERKDDSRAIGAVMSLCGLIIFALLLMLMQDTFTSFTNDLQSGISAVMESNHYFVVGFSDEAITFISETCKAYENTGGITIVVLSDKVSKQDMDKRIHAADVEEFGSRIILRCGNPYNTEDLRHAAAHTAKTIVLFPDLEQAQEMRDAFTLTVLTTLRSKGWPSNGRILAVLALSKNQKLLEDIGGDVTDIVMLESFLAKVMVQCSIRPGMGGVLNEVFGFGGSEFYIAPIPDSLVGKTFSEASLYYPKAVLTGVLTGEARTKGNLKYGRDCNLCPGAEFILPEGSELVLIAEDYSSSLGVEQQIEHVKVTFTKSAFAEESNETVAIPEPVPSGAESSDPSSALTSPGTSPQRKLSRREHSSKMTGEAVNKILVLGWNELAGPVVVELDKFVPANTELSILAPRPEEERQKMIHAACSRSGRKLKNITKISHATGAIGSRYVLEEKLPHPIEDYSRIVIIAEKDTHCSLQADACAVTSVLQIRDLILARDKPKNIPVVLEVQSELSEEMCTNNKIFDFVNTSRLPSQILAAIAYNPRIRRVLHEITDHPVSAAFGLRELAEYIPHGQILPDTLNFTQVCEIAAMSSTDAVVGWTKAYDERRETMLINDPGERGKFHRTMLKMLEDANTVVTDHEYEINPPNKLEQRKWSHTDLVVVLALADS